MGVTEVDPEWIYTNYGFSGRTIKEWGKKVEVDHRYAIVFALTEETVREINHARPWRISLDHEVLVRRPIRMAVDLKNYL